jgi:hypothetical protein
MGHDSANLAKSPLIDCELCGASGCSACVPLGDEPGLAAVELVVRGGAGSIELAGALAAYLSAVVHVDACAQSVGDRVLLRLVVPAMPLVGDDEPRTLPRLRDLEPRWRR